MKKKRIVISLERDKGALKIKMKMPKELEAFFKKISNGEVQQSTYWRNENGEGQTFYNLSDEYNTMIKNILDNKNIHFVDNYGSGLVSGGGYPTKYNIAPLRTKGISEGISLVSEKFESVSNLEIEEYICNIGQITKYIWEGLINKTKIKAIITLEF